MTEERTLVEVEGRRLSLSNLDKVLYPATGTTKRDVLTYYTKVAPALLPHLRDRPVTFRRAPDGVEGQPFYEKNLPKGAPRWVSSIPVASSGRRGGRGSSGSTEINYPAIDGLAALIWAVNLAALELHVPQWRVDRRRRPQPPDLVVFDLDPGAPADLVDCCRVALVLREALEAEGLQAVPKTSGAKGLQLYARADGRSEDTLSFARQLARRLEKAEPERIVSNMRKDLRTGKVLIDWSQNNPTKTTVAPYSLRLVPTPSASTPLGWEEVASAAEADDAETLRFSLDEVVGRVERRGDLFSGLEDPSAAASSTDAAAGSARAAKSIRRSRS
jgi:bifunctional non-homologous end joining protein LigD